MENTDLKLQFKQETGKYPVVGDDFEFGALSDQKLMEDFETYIEWLEGKLEQIQNENYRLKKELNLKTNYNHELRTRY